MIVNYKTAGHHKWAREQLGKEVVWSIVKDQLMGADYKVRKLAAGTTWASVASEFTIKAVVLKVEACDKVNCSSFL